MSGVLRAKKGWKSRTMVVTGEGGEGTELSSCAGTETGDAQVGG